MCVFYWLFVCNVCKLCAKGMEKGGEASIFSLPHNQNLN